MKRAAATGTVVVTLAKRWREVGPGLDVAVVAADGRRATTRFNAEGVARPHVFSGLVDVYVSAAMQNDKPLVSIRGVTVPPDGQADDPRLRDVELPASLVWADLAVRDGAGALIEKAELRIAPGDPQNPPAALPISGGLARLLVSSPPLVVEVGAPGFRMQVVRIAPGENKVTLRPAAEVVFTLRGRPTLPDGVKLSLRMELVRADVPMVYEHRLRSAASLVEFDAEGRQRQPISVPGSYEGRWILLTREPGAALGTPVKGAELVSFRVADQDGPQEIPVDCPVELVEAAAQKYPKPAPR
jgi:hypothetical protein